MPDLRRLRARAEVGLRPQLRRLQVRSTKPGPLSVAALKNGEVQVVELFSSDGNVVSNNFVALTDNKHLEGGRLHRPGHPQVGGHPGRGRSCSTRCRPS